MNFKCYTFKDLAEFRYGKMPQKSRLMEKGVYPVFSGYRYVGYYDEYNVEANKLIVIARGVGGTGEVKITREKCYLTNLSIVVDIKDESVVSTTYLYYLFRVYNLRYLDSGSAQSQITISDLEKLQIMLPEISVQKKIAIFFSNIDEKILVNMEINKNLEEQAQAIFNAWFVDLLPFNRKIPSDWKILKFADIAELSAGGDKPAIVSETKSKECPYPIYANGIAFNGLYGYTNIPRVKAESVTISARGTIGFVCLRNIPYVPIVRLITAIPKEHLVSAKYLYFWLKHIPIAGTGTTQQQLTIPAFKNTEILVPPIDIIIEFTDKVSHLFNLRYLYETEIETLTSLRDALLPRLMSGELDVSNIEL